MSAPKYLLSDIKFDEQEEQAVLDVVRSGWLSLGPQTRGFEEDFAEFVGAGEAVAVTNGTAALHLGMASLGIGPGDEVLVPSYTFVATANAVLHTGAKPVFLDIAGPHDLNLCAEAIEASITPATRAIVVVHLAGFIADMDRIVAIAKKHGLFVVEDACHAIGATYTAGDRSSALYAAAAGTLSDVGCFSFFANKNLVTGEGGMLVTNHPDVAERARLGRSHGMTKSSWDKAKGRATGYDVVQPGYNYRPTELVAAIGKVQLKKLPANIRRRREIVEIYRERLEPLPVEIPFLDRCDDAAHHIMPVLVQHEEMREPFRADLLENGVQTSVHYPPVHRFTHFAELCDSGNLERTEDVAARELTLPLHTGLLDKDVFEICRIIERCAEMIPS